MTRHAYYQELKVLARNVRAAHGLTTAKVTLTDLRRIYKTNGIKIDLWKHRMKKVRGAYFNDEDGPRVVVDATLPTEQRIYTLAHELKHHLVDQGESEAMQTLGLEAIEIGAEVFAAELIFPEEAFVAAMLTMNVQRGACTAEDVIRLKRQTGTTLSFTALGKRAEFTEFAPKGSLSRTQWRKLEESLFGEPAYKRILRYKQARSGARQDGSIRVPDSS